MAVAIGLGLAGTLSTRASQGFRRWPFAVLALGCIAGATVSLSWLVQRLPVGVVYAVWTGLAAVVLVVVDRVVFRLRLYRRQLAGMVVALTGVVLLSAVVR